MFPCVLYTENAVTEKGCIKCRGLSRQVFFGQAETERRLSPPPSPQIFKYVLALFWNKSGLFRCPYRILDYFSDILFTFLTTFVLITKLESLSVSLFVGLSFYLSYILLTFLTTFVLITKLKSLSVFLSVCLSVCLSIFLTSC